jgi:hypothetical protein
MATDRGLRRIHDAAGRDVLCRRLRHACCPAEMLKTKLLLLQEGGILRFRP